MRDKPSVVGRGRPISNSDTFYQPHLGIPLPPSRTCSALSVFLMSPTTKAVLPRRSVAPVGWTPIYLCLTWACEGGGGTVRRLSSDLRYGGEYAISCSFSHLVTCPNPVKQPPMTTQHQHLAGTPTISTPHLLTVHCVTVLSSAQYFSSAPRRTQPRTTRQPSQLNTARYQPSGRNTDTFT